MNKYSKHLVPGDSPLLRKICSPIQPGQDITKVAKTMEKVCKKGTTLGYGLAAPQIGHAIRLVYINGVRGGNGSLRSFFMVNPVIAWRSAAMNLDKEGCLSFPGILKEIARPDKIKVWYETLEREPRVMDASGLLARVICHELDHLEGLCLVGQDEWESEGKRKDLLHAAAFGVMG